MKNNISVIFLLFIFLFSTNLLWGQEKKNSITVSGAIAHYIKIEDFNVTPFDGYYVFPLSPGAELIYSRQIFPKLDLCTGLSFQKVRVSSNVDISYDYILRFRYNELSIPLLLRRFFTLKNQNLWYISLGVYNGKQMNIISEYPERVGWKNWGEIKTIANYSNDHFFTDIYFDIGYSKSHSWGDLSIAPFFKYRINPTWLNTYQNRINWGVKLIYSLKF